MISPATSLIRLACKILTWVVYALTLMSAFSGRVNPSWWALPAALTLLLPWLAIVTAILALTWAICRAWFTSGLGVLTLICGWSAISLAVPVNIPKDAVDGERTFKLISYNVTHGTDMRRPDIGYSRTFRWIIEQDADVVVIQELYKFDKKEVPYWTQALEDSLERVYPHCMCDPYTDRSIFSKYPVEVDRSLSPPREVSLYTDFYLVHFPGHDLHIADCHLYSYQLTKEERNLVKDMANPNKTKNTVGELKTSIREKMSHSFKIRAERAADLREVLDMMGNPAIVCGDFNDVPSSWTYTLLRGDDFHDAFAEAGFGPAPTFNKHFFYFRLDQIFYRGNLRPLSVKRGNINSSDHFPLIATFAFTRDTD